MFIVFAKNKNKQTFFIQLACVQIINTNLSAYQ